jgi:hypothetical protein
MKPPSLGIGGGVGRPWGEKFLNLGLQRGVQGDLGCYSWGDRRGCDPCPNPYVIGSMSMIPSPPSSQLPSPQPNSPQTPPYAWANLRSLGRSAWGIALGVTLAGVIGPMGSALALPGDSVRQVQAWIKAHPTLQPAPGETLRVRKQNTAAQRFTYEASVWAPGRLEAETIWGKVRSESIELFDMVNGVTPARLEESLRVVQGLDIYQDYSQGAVVYRYPVPVQDDRLRSQLTPLQLARQGEIRLGSRFAYWLEVVNNPDGTAYNGTIVVFLREDVDKLESELRQ